MKSLYVFIFLFCCYGLTIAQNQRKIDSLNKLLSVAGEEEKAKLMLKLSALHAAKDPGKSQEYLTQVMTLLEKYPNDSTKSRALNLMGQVYRKTSDYKKAKDFGQRSIEFARKINDSDMWAISLNSMANLFFDEGSYDKSVELYYEAYRIHGLIGNSAKSGSALTGIANSYLLQKKYDKALEYYNRGYDHWKSYDNKQEMAKMLNSKGVVYLQTNQFDKALKIYNEAMQIANELNDNDLRAYIYLNIGNIYGRQGKYAECIEYFRKSADIREKMNDKYNLSQSLNNIGAAYLLLGDHQKSETYLLKALAIAKEINARQFILKQYGDLAELYGDWGKFEKAFRYQKRFVNLNDSLNNQKNKASINELQTKYETREKEKQIELLNKDKIISDHELARQKIINASVISGLVLAASLGMLVFRGYRQKKKANLQLQKAFNTIEEKNMIVEEKNKEILDSIHYAKRIQGALLASASLLKNNLNEHFVLYKPKDIVSGDFYWAASVSAPAQTSSAKDSKGLFYLAVCDSTGHGVPGAFMSLLNISFMNEAITEKKLKEPNEIFDHVRQRLIENISQDGQKDGMDAVLLCIDSASGKITYSAANNAPVLISNNSILELGCDKMPVGMGETDRDFSRYEVEYKSGDVLYLFTDGYADQFGGPKGKKFKYKKLEELLVDISHEPLNVQSGILEEKFNNWRGKLEQVDDVCIVGIRL